MASSPKESRTAKTIRRTQVSARPAVAPVPSIRNTPRRIILCLDGTANNPFTERRRQDGSKIVKPTNVLKLARAIQPRSTDGQEQFVYYDTGVGALGRYPGFSNRFLAASDKVLGGLGAGFEQNVEDALHFLALNYRSNDHVFVFGFSRGAATAQALTRFLDWTGGLPVKGDAYFLPFLFRMFAENRGAVPCVEAVAKLNADLVLQNRTPLQAFRPIPIRFLGVWDTVMALGSRFRATGEKTSTANWSFYMAPKPAHCVLHARQALAIDEVRYDFRPEVWLGHHAHQSMQQRWFAGVHSNIGGSYVDDGLANISFHWMLAEAGQQGLEFDSEFVKHYRPYPVDRMYRSDVWYYRIFDAVRRKLGRGRRALVGYEAAANISLDPSVISRMHWAPTPEAKHEEMDKAYRPRNAIQLLATQPDLQRYLERIGTPPAEQQLPLDVMEQIEAFRALTLLPGAAFAG